MRNLLFTFIYGIVFTISALAQVPQTKFTRININDGLSLSSVYCIFQDSKGFMWFGTEDGLNRYDGKKFTIFRPRTGENNSLSDKWVDGIFEDKYNFLWFITQAGISKFDPRYETFKRYLTDNRTSNSTAIISYYEDYDSIIWIGTQKGAYRYDRANDKFEKVESELFKDKNTTGFIQINKNQSFIATTDGLYAYIKNKNKVIKTELPQNNTVINFLYRDYNQNIWVTSQNYLYLFSGNNRFESYKVNDTSVIESIFQDTKLRYWVGTSDGFYRFTLETKTFERVIEAPELSGSLSINKRKPIAEDFRGNIWFGTFGRGVFKFDNLTQKIQNFLPNITDPNSLSESAVNSIFQDNANCMWFGTFGAGINKYDPYSAKFPLLKHNPDDNNSLAGNFVWSVFETRDGNVWIGTNSNGVDCYETTTGNFTHYANNPNNANSLSHNCVREIFEDSKDILWFGTNGGGLNRYDRKTKKFTVYKNNPDNPNSLSSNSVRVVFEARNGIFWLATTNGFNCFEPETGKFKTYFHDANNPKSISSNFIYSTIYEDENGLLYLGNYSSGLSIFDPKTETFQNFQHSETDTTTIINDYVNSFTRDHHNYFWLATYGGLVGFDSKTKIFQNYTVEDGLPINTLYAVLCDKRNNLWISTNFGISRFNIPNKTFKNYDVNDGLQSNEFNGGAFHLGRSGRMYFAGVYGLNLFYPDTIRTNPNSPKVVISDFKIFNSTVEVLSPDIEPDINIENNIYQVKNIYYLRKSISYTDTIILSYQEKVFSFEYAALHYSNPQKNNYKYRLVNFEKKWNESANRNYVTYTNIDAGTYIFEVTASNSDGLWSDEVTRVTIIITPPFWETWWFRIAFLVSFAGGVIVGFQRRVRFFRRQKERLEVIVKERTSEIVTKNLMLEQQKGEIQMQANNLETANTEITQQKELIEKSHKNITDSILYAKRIQSAVMPDNEHIDQLLPQHFILFMPRDIVSGDFYYIKKVKDTIIIAAADCTGHGVPGAFMSMLAITLLNEIILNKEITTSSQVLEELRKQIKIALQQTGQKGEQQDGLDVAFCAINQTTMEMSFAGAYNPCWIFRNELRMTNDELGISNVKQSVIRNSQFVILEPDHQPVGIYLKEKPFTESKITLQKDDVIYLFSDGYQSQFGGEKDIPLKSGYFKEILSEIHHLPLSEQHIILENKFNAWKGDNLQTDDVLVLGVRI